MLTARRTRTISAPIDDLWDVMRDPHHLPRWWPRVVRVEDVADGAFTEVMKTRKGKTVRADFDIVEVDEEARTLRWDQRVQGTPFEAVLSSSLTELRLVAVDARGEANGPGRLEGGAAATEVTEVTIELRQVLSGQIARGGWYTVALPRMRERMVRRAAAATIDEALDGLQRISG
jgi:uncharacterized protein YndB with AHSA1/START domain